MGYYAAYSGKSLPTFWGNLSVPSSRVNKSKKNAIRLLVVCKGVSILFWYFAPSGRELCFWRFGITCCLHLHGQTGREGKRWGHTRERSARQYGGVAACPTKNRVHCQSLLFDCFVVHLRATKSNDKFLTGRFAPVTSLSRAAGLFAPLSWH